MRNSPLRHPVAVLRQALGLNQKQFADLIVRSRPTVQAVELCKLPLSEKLAEDISNATGIDPGWLLAGDPEKPIRHMNGHPYNPGDFEIWRAEQNLRSSGVAEVKPENPDSLLARDQKIYGEIFAAILRSALRAGMTKHAIAKHRIEDFAKDMAREFGVATPLPDHSKLIESVIASVAHSEQGPLKVVDSGTATMETRQSVPVTGSSSPAERKAEA